MVSAVSMTEYSKLENKSTEFIIFHFFGKHEKLQNLTYILPSTLGYAQI